MTWIDCKIRLPTEADADKNGRVLWVCRSGLAFCAECDTTVTELVAWMPIPEFTPLPDPPEGYEILTDYGLSPHPEAMFWGCPGQWMDRLNDPDTAYNRDSIYAVPIAPPEPQYRPFQNAEEFRPLRDRWWRNKHDNTLCSPANYNNHTHHGHSWLWCFENIAFEDGTPFGVPVN